MSFFSRNNRPVRKVPPIGDGTAPVYEEFTENGSKILKVTGKENLHSFVQSSKEDTLIYNILSRYQRGDESALNARVGQYMDVVGMPTNLAEAHQVMLDVQRKFDSLSPEMKQKFNNDVSVFVDKVSHSTPDQLKDLFGVSQEQIDAVKDGDNDVT